MSFVRVHFKTSFDGVFIFFLLLKKTPTQPNQTKQTNKPPKPNRIVRIHEYSLNKTIITFGVQLTMTLKIAKK